MSLTSLLTYNTEIKSLFAGLPSFKSVYKTKNADSIPFPPNASSRILVKRSSRPNPVIGHAYDYWLRAYVQRINGLHQETSPVDLAASVTVKLLNSSGMDLRKEYQEMVKRRNEYIRREREDDQQYLEDCMALANLDVYYRAGYVPESGFQAIAPEDKKDLSNLAEETKSYDSFFAVKDNLVCNPEFGLSSLLVGGADADLIIDDTLIEIKTESTFGYKASHVRQLIAYYMLSMLTPSFQATINKLAVFNPRYCRYNYLELTEIKEIIDFDAFMEKFVKIICHPSFAEDNYRATPTLKQIQSEIMDTYQSLDKA